VHVYQQADGPRVLVVFAWVEMRAGVGDSRPEHLEIAMRKAVVSGPVRELQMELAGCRAPSVTGNGCKPHGKHYHALVKYSTNSARAAKAGLSN